MFCTKCGRELAQGLAFCPYCGQKVMQDAALQAHAEAAKIPPQDEPRQNALLYSAEVSGLLKSGRLEVYADRAEFISSSVQKTVFYYSTLMGVKKGLDRINFITADGQTVPCTINRAKLHEAFVYIEKAAAPYIAQRKARLAEQGIFYSMVSSMGLTGGVLEVRQDRVEFRAKGGKTETVGYERVKSAGLSMGALELTLTDGTTRSFGLEKELREEVCAFVNKSAEPYAAQRRQALREAGIFYSCLSSHGAGSGTLNAFEDRLEYAGAGGEAKTVPFAAIRTASLSMGSLEIGLTSGLTLSFTVEREIANELLEFVQAGIAPYVARRTEGFDRTFGADEQIEVNEARGVWHILRLGGSAISEEYPLDALEGCSWTESVASGMLDSVLSGGMALLSGAAKAAGVQAAPAAEEKLRWAGVVLALRTGDGVQKLTVRLGDFALGAARSSKKYLRCRADCLALQELLAQHCPACECVPPQELPHPPAQSAAGPATGGGAALPAPAAGSPEPEEGRDEFGIIKYIEGVSGFIGECSTPMTIAIQGGSGGKNSMMKLLADSLTPDCRENLVWFHTWQFSQVQEADQLPALAGSRLIAQLGGAGGAAAKDRAIKAAKGLIGITSGLISQGSSDGQSLMDALFRENAPDSLEKLVHTFAGLVHKRAGAGGKVLIFIDDLDRLSPAQAVLLLRAMRSYFECEGCVFVIAADYDFVLRGVAQCSGPDFEQSQGKAFFDQMFQVSFRVPVSSLHVQNYVTGKLSQVGIAPEDEQELELYAALIQHSVGYKPQNMDRLFNSFLLLKKLTDDEIYKNRSQRLTLFGLVCMQARFRDVYDALLRMKEQITPEYLASFLSGEAEEAPAAEREAFCEFMRVFCSLIDTDQTGALSQEECRSFAKTLELSGITSK